ncbi:hypothetical protein [Klebsiella aerogenes]|uniref:hypothetical protein n=1 Tax=Klebsiella aerogenes TaxID=548 RepID=UPI002A82DB2C|nr:hypothetical protein [Klebsiella aerogenes]WPS00503.1 hypothetical protein SM790_09205 [Klebsiella aerogenes]WPS39834.1 hypothetical protein SM910_09455 [Klebsiella aerogenes]
MTDITRLLASLKRRSARAKDFGDDVTFVKLKDIDELVEALEKAQQRIDELENDEVRQRLANTEHQLYMAELAKHNLKASRKAQFRKRKAAEQRIAELESRTVNIKFAPIHVEELGNVRDGKKHPYMFGAGYNSAVIHCESVIQQELDAKGIKWEAE